MEGAQQWDIDFSFGIDEVQAEHVGAALPSSTAYLASARDGKGSASITVKPTQRDIRLTLSTTDGESDTIVDDVAAEIRQVKFMVTEKAQSYVAKIRIYGLTPEDGAMILANLGNPVSVFVDQMQIEMEFDGAPIGAVVTGSNGLEDVYGVLTQKRGDKYVIDDFGLLHTVDSVGASINLGPADIARALSDYADVSRGQGMTPSWKYIIQALGVCGIDDGVSDEVIKNAFGWQLPPEAGTVNG